MDKEQLRQKLIEQCRFYKGEKEYPKEKFKTLEKESPYALPLLYWIAEEWFVRTHIKEYFHEYLPEDRTPQRILEILDRTGLSRFSFMWRDIVSDTLIAFVFSYLMKSRSPWDSWEKDVVYFVDKQLPAYLGVTSI